MEDRRSLEHVLKANDKTLPRFYMQDGQSIIGRFIGARDGTITIRRPSGGLRSIPIADIEQLEIMGDDGTPILGRLVALDDGTIGWDVGNLFARDTPDIAPAAAEPPVESGGPLIKIAPEAAGGLQPRTTNVLEVDDDDSGKALVREAAVKKGGRLTTSNPSFGNDGSRALSSSIRMSMAADEVSETDEVMYFRLALSEPAQQPVAIIYSILDGSATADADYKHRQGVLVFSPGEQEKALAIDIIDDDDIEESETFKLFVTGDPNTVTIDTRTVEAKIQDNDS